MDYKKKYLKYKHKYLQLQKQIKYKGGIWPWSGNFPFSKAPSPKTKASIDATERSHVPLPTQKVIFDGFEDMIKSQPPEIQIQAREELQNYKDIGPGNPGADLHLTTMFALCKKEPHIFFNSLVTQSPINARAFTHGYNQGANPSIAAANGILSSSVHREDVPRLVNLVDKGVQMKGPEGDRARSYIAYQMQLDTSIGSQKLGEHFSALTSHIYMMSQRELTFKVHLPTDNPNRSQLDHVFSCLGANTIAYTHFIDQIAAGNTEGLIGNLDEHAHIAAAMSNILQHPNNLVMLRRGDHIGEKGVDEVSKTKWEYGPVTGTDIEHTKNQAVIDYMQDTFLPFHQTVISDLKANIGGTLGAIAEGKLNSVAIAVRDMKSSLNQISRGIPGNSRALKAGFGAISLMASSANVASRLAGIGPIALILDGTSCPVPSEPSGEGKSLIEGLKGYIKYVKSSFNTLESAQAQAEAEAQTKARAEAQAEAQQPLSPGSPNGFGIGMGVFTAAVAAVTSFLFQKNTKESESSTESSTPSTALVQAEANQQPKAEPQPTSSTTMPSPGSPPWGGNRN
jgi:hypothetical protein